MYTLSILGFSSFFAEQQDRWRGQPRIPARVVAEHRGGYEVWGQESAGLARLSGKLQHQQCVVAVGDWVGLRDPPAVDQITVIESLFERRTVFTRGSAGRQARPQIVAANVDQVFIVCGLDEDFNVHRIERYLARIWASGANPMVILNKADRCPDVTGHVRTVESHALGVPIFVSSARLADGIVPIAASVAPGTTAAFVGSSGAGKSTLINALLGEDKMTVAATRAGDGRGRHTTTSRQLVVLTQGGLLLDTPGMRELQLLDEGGLAQVFDDVESLSANCRFRDCQHAEEPGCAVTEAVRSGNLSSDRMQHYQQLQREARAYQRRHDERQRRQSERIWGQLYEEALRIRKWKEGS